MNIKLITALLFLLGTVTIGQAKPLYIHNATIYTSEKILENAAVLIDGKTIKAVGKQLQAPVGATVIDAQGGLVTAGLFNAYTHLGVSEIDGIASTVDIYSENTEVTAAIKIADAFNPASVMLPNNQINGLTHAIVMPESDVSIFAGQAAIVELSNNAKVIDDSIAIVVQLGESGQQLSGGSRAAALALLRVALDEAKRYRANSSAIHKGVTGGFSNSYADLEALGDVVSGHKPLIVNVNRAADIRQVLNLASQYQIKLVLSGIQEGWKVATDIAAAKTPVIIDPIYNLPTTYETLGARLDNANILHEAGVTLMFTGMTWHNTHNAYLVKQSAGNAVANGLPMAVAMAAMTINPAKVFGLDSVGEIKAGMSATLVLWSGDPLELMSYPTMVIVNGVQSKGMSRQLRLRDRYFSYLKNTKIQ